MNEVSEFLSKNIPLYMATVEGDQPRVRPMGFSIEWDGKPTFATLAGDGCSKQIHANPHFEISATSSEMESVRMWATAKFLDNEAKAKILEASPNLQQMSTDPEKITVWSAEDAEASFMNVFTREQHFVKH